jgi:integrase
LHDYDTSTTKERRKLTRDLLEFLPEIGASPSLYDVLPRDVIQFLMFRDRSGLTVVHRRTCSLWSNANRAEIQACDCPQRQNATSTSVTRGILQGIFRDAGLVDRWQPATLSGNPVKSAEVEQFIRLNNREQLTAGVSKRRAPLFGRDVYHHIVDAAVDRWKAARRRGALAAAVICARDMLFVALLWHTGLRASDLLRVLVQQLEKVPPGRGDDKCWKLAVTVTKTNDDPRGIRSITLVDDNSFYCVQTAFRLYSRSLHTVGLKLEPGPLFRGLKRSKAGTQLTWTPQPLAWSAANYRWKALLMHARVTSRITMHSPHGSRPRWERDRGTPLSEIRALIDWTQATLDYYTLDRTVLSLADAKRLYMPALPRTARGRARSVDPGDSRQ